MLSMQCRSKLFLDQLREEARESEVSWRFKMSHTQFFNSNIRAYGLAPSSAVTSGGAVASGGAATAVTLTTCACGTAA